MKKALIVSLVLNVILIIAIVMGSNICRKMFLGIRVDDDIAFARLQEVYLKELDSADPKRIEAIKDLMKRKIENSKRLEKSWAEVSK